MVPHRGVDELLDRISFFGIFKMLCSRTADYLWTDYLIATEAEVVEEKRWAEQRDCVIARHAHKGMTAAERQLHINWGVEPTSGFDALTFNERCRYDKYRVLFPATPACPRAYDLN